MKQRLLKTLIATLVPALVLFIQQAAVAFQHPGIPLTVADLDDVKSNLNNSPWNAGYASLVSDSRSSTNYTMQGPFTYVNRNNSGNYDHETAWKNDMQAIFNLARMWYFTGDSNYAKKSHDILLAWANTMTNFGGIESSLDLGDYAYRYGGGADILRGTWPGWTAADTATVSNFFANVYWPATGNQGQTKGPTNKGALQMAGGLAIAIFNDDTNKFNFILNVYRSSASCGLDNNCLSSGEMGETGRDQGHSYADLLQMSFLAEVFWKQGVDLYSSGDNRLLACGEYYGRNNLSPAAAYIVYGTTDALYWNNSTNSGGSSAGGAYTSEPMAGNILRSAYVLRKGLTAPWMVLKRTTQNENEDSFCYLKTSDSSTAAPPAALSYYVPAPTVTTGFADADIGSASPAGSASYSGGVWTVKGGGSEIWTTGADSCHFTYRQLTGDFTLIAKVNSVQPTGGTAKAGLMIRDSLSSTAANRAWVAITAAQTAESYLVGNPDCYGGWFTTSRGIPQSVYWVKMQRYGQYINLYTSLDGTSWACISAGYFWNMPNTAYVGLVVCSMNNGTLNTSAFGNVSITGGDGGNVTVPPAPYAIYASPDAGRVPLRWLQSFGATGYNVLRSTNTGGPYTTIAAVTNASCVDTNVKPNTTYYYVISATNQAGASANSPEDSATTQPTPQPPAWLTALPGNGKAALYWSASSGATSYNIKRSTSSGSGYVTITNVASPGFMDTGLVNGTTYYYVIAAVSAAGEGSNSSEASVMPNASAAVVSWSGAVNGTWDTGTANWLNNGASSLFQDGNSSVFDDSVVSNTAINLSASRSPRTILINNSANNFTFSGSSISGTGSVVKTGSATVTFNNVNTFSGGASLVAGTVTIGNGGALGTGAITLNGGTLNDNVAVTVTNKIIAQPGSTSMMDAAANLTISGPITGNGTITRGAAAAASLYLAGDNSQFTGVYEDQNNGNSITRWASPSAGSANAVWIFNQAQTSSRTSLDFNNGTIQFGSISGAGYLDGNSSGTKIVQVGALGLNDVFGGTLLDGAGVIALTKVGSGTLTLTGANNNYSGQTTISNGELIVSSSFATRGSCVVNGGAAFAVTNGTSGSGSISNLVLSAGSTFELINVASSTPLLVCSNISIAGSCTVKITEPYGISMGTYPLVNYTGKFQGSFDNLQLQLPSGMGGTLVSNANQIALTVSPVPVPSAPASVSATAGDSQVALAWSAVTNASGYNLKYSVTNGGAYTVLATNLGGLAFTNTSLANGIVYYYVISALNQAGESTNSPQISARPVSLLSPNLAFSVSGDQIQLNWSADHTGWRLQAQTNAPGAGLGTNWTTISGSTNGSQILMPIDPTNSSVFFRLVYP